MGEGGAWRGWAEVPLGERLGRLEGHLGQEQRRQDTPGGPGLYNTHRSPYGAVDMSGNVYEWVSDWHGKGYYRNAPNRNPEGPASGRGRVVRGGPWSANNPSWFRTAFRNRAGRDYRNFHLGFRCAKAS